MTLDGSASTDPSAASSSSRGIRFRAKYGVRPAYDGSILMSIAAPFETAQKSATAIPPLSPEVMAILQRVKPPLPRR
jgi:hypothetical protein